MINATRTTFHGHRLNHPWLMKGSRLCKLVILLVQIAPNQRMPWAQELPSQPEMAIETFPRAVLPLSPSQRLTFIKLHFENHETIMPVMKSFHLSMLYLQRQTWMRNMTYRRMLWVRRKSPFTAVGSRGNGHTIGSRSKYIGWDFEQLIRLIYKKCCSMPCNSCSTRPGWLTNQPSHKSSDVCFELQDLYYLAMVAGRSDYSETGVWFQP